MGKRAKTRTEGKQDKVINWKEYNESLVRRGDVTLWLEEDVIIDWQHENDQVKVGAPYVYSDQAIVCLLSLREVFRLTYRQTEGFGRSLVRLMGIDLKIPDYTNLQKRAAKLAVALNVTAVKGGRDIVIDSTGLKVYGEGEWKARKHGASKRRTWRKFHIGIDPKTGEIIAEQLTGNDIHDAEPVEAMIDQVNEPIERFFGDGAYDQRKVYDVLNLEAVEPIIPPRRNAKLWQHGNSNKPKLPRDQAVREIRRSSRKAWKIKADYHIRSLGETVMYRLKTVFGGELKNRKLPNQKTEASIRCRVLNQFTQLGRSKFQWS
jgi:hypothetical protein